MSTFTFAASANAVAYVGATPVFVDSSAADWNPDLELLEQSLASRAAAGGLPAAVISVDLDGQPADYRRIEPICAGDDVPLIEDAAEALGSSLEGRPAGSSGLVAALSFNGNKMITTSRDGMLVGADEALIERVRLLSTQAREPAPHCEHHEIGFNFRLSNLLAAFGRGQLSTLNERFARRRGYFNRYVELLRGGAHLDRGLPQPLTLWVPGPRWGILCRPQKLTRPLPHNPEWACVGCSDSGQVDPTRSPVEASTDGAAPVGTSGAAVACVRHAGRPGTGDRSRATSSTTTAFTLLRVPVIGSSPIPASARDEASTSSSATTTEV